jgi:hypothetical protein
LSAIAAGANTANKTTIVRSTNNAEWVRLPLMIPSIFDCRIPLV